MLLIGKQIVLGTGRISKIMFSSDFSFLFLFTDSYKGEQH